MTNDPCIICHRPRSSTGAAGACEGTGSRLCYQLGYRRVSELLAVAKVKLVELGVKVDLAIEQAPDDEEAPRG